MLYVNTLPFGLPPLLEGEPCLSGLEPLDDPRDDFPGLSDLFIALYFYLSYYLSCF